MAGRMQKIAPIQTRTILAEDEKVIGIHTDGRQIIERTFMRDIPHAVLDKKGNQAYKPDQFGRQLTPIRELVPTEFTEVYVYNEAHGQNYKNPDFRPGADELDKREKRARIEALRDNFFEEAEEVGMDAQTLARGFQERYAEAPQEPPVTESADEAQLIADGEARAGRARKEARERDAKRAEAAA